MPIATTALLCFVFAVSDGDTLKARCADPATGHGTTQVVRLASIDAPEREQPYGRRARKALGDMALNKTVRLDCRTRDDRYGRSLCTVWVTPTPCSQHSCEYSLNANLAMLTSGMAWWEERFAREQPAQQRDQYEHAQAEARSRRAGLWREGGKAIAPWDWRREHPATWPHAHATRAMGTGSPPQ